MLNTALSQFASARLFIVTALAVALVACSGQSPVSPAGLSSDQGIGADAKGGTPAAPGVYALTFHAAFPGGYQEVTTLSVSAQSLWLKAVVTDASGNAAKSGTVTFEYCSYGKPTDDITNPDEAPMEACDQGAATWAQLRRAIRVPLCPPSLGGSVCTTFSDAVRIPRTVGFRFRYAQQGSSIASATSEARNFVWVPQS